MIVLTHNNKTVLRVEDLRTNKEIVFQVKDSIIDVMYDVAEQFPNRFLVWQHSTAVTRVNFDYINEIPALERKCLSFSSEPFFSDAIGYVEQSPFINIKRKVCYPTWQMSGLVGGIHAHALLQFKTEVREPNFSFALNAIAKSGMPQGLWCYSNPNLLKTTVSPHEKQASMALLFKFVKQHYKWVWIWLLVLNRLVFERTFSFTGLWKALINKRVRVTFEAPNRNVPSNKLSKDRLPTIDVIIPTIGRPDYLYDVLTDLRKQSHLPKRVIIVEQNPAPESVSDLHYLHTETWPFEIDHTFTHQTGACFARNLALTKVQSEWVFLNDDDNRFDSDLLTEVLKCADQYGVEAILTSYLQPHEKLRFIRIHQTSIFGSGNSFVKAKYLSQVAFDMSLEFGYGEDTDFGMQLRNIGVDVVYFPNLSITHLKAPRGGFRSTFIQPWEHEKVQPKPSPTIMYLKQKHYTKQQIQGYQLLLFFKMHKLNLFKIRSFLKRWKQSEKWAKLLSEKSQNAHA